MLRARYPRTVSSAGRTDPIPAPVWLAWAAANIIGGVVIALPDEGPRLFSLSRTHGPSAIDAVGAALVLGGWIVLDAATIVRWRADDRRRIPLAAIGLVVLGIAILVPSIALDLGAWWVLGAGLVAAVQVWAAATVARRRGVDAR